MLNVEFVEIKNLSSNIKKCRELKNFTREHLAAELDMSLSGYSKIERGEIDLTVSKLQKIANVLQVSVSEILDFDANSIFKIQNNIETQSSRKEINIPNNPDTVDVYTRKYILMLENEIERLKR
jgi:transcriptional regulator with XRE-family HTH domain